LFSFPNPRAQRIAPSPVIATAGSAKPSTVQVGDMSSTLPANKITTALHVLTGLIVLGYAVSAWVVGPSMYADQGMGFLAFEGWTHGGPFNVVPVPDPANIALNKDFFVAWWSPGQYLVPGLFELMGFDLGHAMTITLVLCAVLALVGLHLLYRSWGFPPLSIAVTLLVLCCTRLFSHQFVFYGGGEVLITALTPWFLLLLFRLRDFSALHSAILFVAIFVLTVAKLSGLVLAVASIGTVILLDLWSDQPSRGAGMVVPMVKLVIRDLRSGFRGKILNIGIAIALFGILFQIFWLSKGDTPTSNPLNVFSPGKALTHAIPAFVACFTSILSLGDFSAATLMHPGHEIFRQRYTFYLLIALPVGILTYVVGRQIARSHPDYFRFAATLTIVFWLIMTAVYVRGGEVSLEDRHFRQIGMVLAIGVVHAALNWRRLPAFAAAGVAIVLCAYGGASYVVKLRTNMQSAKGDMGFRHMVLSRPALDFIRTRLNTPPGGSSLVVIPSAEIALEFRTRRTVEIAADFMTPSDLRDRLAFRGRVDSLGVLFMTKLVDNGKAAIALAAFKDYPVDGWTKTAVGDFTYFSQGR
jgi:hypothetical protein